MDKAYPLQGLWCALLTPLDAKGTVDGARFARHAKELLAQGIDGVAPFGTTGEGQSFSQREREAGLESLIAAGIAPQKIVPGTGAASLTETIALTRHAVQANATACLVLPPFFFKEITDDGLYSWYARLIEGVGDSRLRVLLYHIPQVSGIAFSADLVARLARDFPGIIAGVKDSFGDWQNTERLLQRVPDLAIFVGHEPHIPRLLRAGGAGTICGVANVRPALVKALMQPTASDDDIARVVEFIEIAFRQPFLPAFKAIVAERTRDDGWLAVRAPLIALDANQRRVLQQALQASSAPL
jgi:4-hydroxy-tetrahydrodipicolinate synthase